MSKLTQGTQIYLLDPDAHQVIAIDCATAFNPGGAPSDQIDTTCLESRTRTYMRGLRTPGQASLTVNADPQYASHIRLYELSQDDGQDALKWAVGWSDGTAIPTVNADGDDFILPTSRTWFVFEAYVADFPFDFAANSVVTTSASLQRTGGSAWVRKSAEDDQQSAILTSGGERLTTSDGDILRTA